MNNFYPSPQGEIKKRPGTKIIPFRRESLFKRLRRWVRGEPHDIRTMSEFKGVLMVWLIFLQDPQTGSIHCTGHRHNTVKDYRLNPYFVGMKKVSIDLERLDQ